MRTLIENGECYECKSDIYEDTKHGGLWICKTCGTHGPLGELVEIPIEGGDDEEVVRTET